MAGGEFVELERTRHRPSLEVLHVRHRGKVADTWSAYLHEYDRILDAYRDAPVNLLEIGVQNGGSLEIWGEYFGRAGAIIGCDINPDCKQLRFEDPRISVIVADANSDEAERQISSKAPLLDVIIDDGSHRSSDIVKSFARYFPRLRDGGVFVIEDLHCSYWQEFEGGLFHPFSAMTFLKRLADVINHEHWGVDRARGELLRGINEQYGVQLVEHELARIHSLEFMNSMCVIRKAAAEANVLGRRNIVGSDASVLDAVLEYRDQLRTDMPSQGTNGWSTAMLPPEQELLALESVRYTAEERAQEIKSLCDQVLTQTAVLEERGAEIERLSAAFISAQALAHERAAALDRLSSDLSEARAAASKAAHDLEESERDRARLSEVVLELKTVGGFPSSRPKPVKRVQRRAVSDSPLVTVVIPSFNHRRFIIQAVESVLAQTHTHLELIVIDDGSSDDTVDALRARYGQDARVSLVARDNRGAHQTINEAIGRGRGEFVSILNSDDVYEPERLSKLVEAARQRGGHPFFGISGLRVVDEAGKPSQKSGPLTYYASVLDKFLGEPDPAAFWVGNLAMTTSNFFFSREVFEGVGGFSPLRYTHDWDWGLRAAERFKLVRLDEVLLHYRVHGTNTIAESNIWKHIAENAYVFASALQRAGLTRMAEIAGLTPIEVMRALLSNESFAPVPTLFLMALGLDEEALISLLRSGALENILPSAAPGELDLMLSAEHLRRKLKAAQTNGLTIARAPERPPRSWSFRLRKVGARWRRQLIGQAKGK
jgi:glycosyltransferase involved in cell wall biosynthesis